MKQRKPPAVELYTPKTRRLANTAERRFAEAAAANNLIAVKRGWPDFWLMDPSTNEITAVVEVKPAASHPLKREQVMVMRFLAAHGVKCFKWTPDYGFLRISNNPQRTPD